MANKSGTRNRGLKTDISFPISLIGDGTTVNFDRNRSSSCENGTYHLSPINIPPNPGSEEIIPWFKGSNNEPEYLLKLIEGNPILLGLLVTKVAIMYGRGLALFRREGKKLNPISWDEYPDEIRDFWEFNELDQVAYDLLLDHEMLGNAFSKIIFNAGSMKASSTITEIHRIDPVRIRALKKKEGKDISSFVISPTWSKKMVVDQKDTIPKFNRRDFYEKMKFQYETKLKSTLFHLKRNLPGHPHYAIPTWYGGTKFTELHNHIPSWHLSNIMNMFGARVIVSVSDTYIKQMTARPKPGGENDERYTEEEVKDEIVAMVKNYLTNPENVGKSLILRHGFDHQMKPVEHITIKSIKLDIKDDAYKGLIEKLNEVVTSGVGIDPSIAGIIMQGKLSSGSEKRNAWNIELMKSWSTQGMILKPLRFIHKFNKWDPDLVWGFDPHPALVTADENKSGIEDQAQEKKNSSPTPSPQPED
ncbi:MAG: hypothetical protein AAFP92_24960 [Bacteroidota bacterium]